MGGVVVVGSLNADLAVRTARLPRPGETVHGSPLTVSPGGKSSNQAVAASRLGVPTALLGAVGADERGAFLLAALGRAGVDVATVWRLPDAATGTAVITVDDRGENTIVLSPGANGELTPDRLGRLPGLLVGARVLCLCFEVPLPTVVAAARAAHDRGVRVLLNPSPSEPVPAALAALADLLIVNETEAADLLGAPEPLTVGADWAAVAAGLARRGVATAIVTLGAAGSVVLDPAGPTRVPAVAVTAVDTVGCGDAFTGAVAARLAAGDRLVPAARFAARVAAYAATRPGAQASYPTLADLERWDPAAGDRSAGRAGTSA